MPSLFDQAIQFYSCFIGYSSRDQDFADRIHADLQHKGARCWFAPRDMPIGAKILDEIDAAIRLRDRVLLILSEHAIRSDWVEGEVSKAFAQERKRRQTVLLTDGHERGLGGQATRSTQYRRFPAMERSRWYKQSFEHVLRDLRRAAESEK